MAVPAARVPVILALLFCAVSCHKRTAVPTPQNTGAPVATVAVSPTDILSPFLCRITPADLVCMATTDVRFRRGQQEIEFARGYQFTFQKPTGSGTGQVFFGCAGVNSCPGYFIFTSAAVQVTPAEPARYWQNAQTVVPLGSHGIAEVTVTDNAFTQIRNRWAVANTGPVLKAGAGLVITCADDACTIGLK